MKNGKDPWCAAKKEQTALNLILFVREIARAELPLADREEAGYIWDSAL